MKIILIVLIGISGLTAKSQNSFNSSFHIPQSHSNSIEDIAKYINAHFSTDSEKLKAAYTWVIRNIRYDTDSMYVINWNKGNNARVTEAFRRRKGVCENFAAIFSDIAQKCGFNAFVVEGYTRQAGSLDKSGHSWCAVEMNNAWYLCDPTWDKDAGDYLYYFLREPQSMASHMPFDRMWQLVNFPISHLEYNTGKKVKNEYFNYRDSINAYRNLSGYDRWQATLRRMETEYYKNELLRNRISYTKMLIGIVNEEKDKDFYNAAVNNYNEAITQFNQYINLRNQQLINTSVDQAEALLQSVQKSIDLS